MAWLPFKRDSLHGRLKAVRRQLASIHTRRELTLLERELAEHKRAEVYSTADPSEKARMDVDREVAREELTRKHRASLEDRKKARQALIKLPNEAIRYLTAAKASEGYEGGEKAVTIHAQESILEAINGTPFGFDLIAEYRNLLQIPTLIRELYPYKPTILRTLPMLDFVRWICRVTYEEAPVFKGLVKGKVNYICRGMTAKVTPKDEKKDAKTDPTAKQAQKYLDMFLDQQDYQAKRKERRRRMMIEGEAFLWIADGKEPKIESPTACYVEPDFIRPSQKEPTNQEDPHISGTSGDDWSWGVHTPKHQYWKPLAYQIVWNDNDEDKVSVNDMVHTAVRERSNIKRCLPPAFCLVDDMIRMTLLRSALADASKFRAGIGGVVKYEEASVGAVRSWSETVGGTGSLGLADLPPTLEPINAENFTNLISLPPGRDFCKGPDYPEINSLQAIYDWHIRAIAQAEQVPEWMVSGAAAGSSFASSLTSESSSIIEFESEQEAECHVDRRILKRVLAAYVKAELLPETFFDDYDVSVEGEAMVSRDEKSETETAIMAVEGQLCSRHTAATMLGFDPQKEKPLIQQEQQEQADLSLKQQEAELALGVGPAIRGMPKDSSSPTTTNGARSRLESAN